MTGASPQQRRLAGLTAAVAPAPARTAAVAAQPPPQLLSLSQLRQFVRDGFIVLQLSDVARAVHDGIYDTAFAIEGEPAEQAQAAGGATTWLRRGGEDEEDDDEEEAAAGGGLSVSVAQTRLSGGTSDDCGWDDLTPAFRELMDSAILRGAVASICGEGYSSSEYCELQCIRHFFGGTFY